MSKDQEDLTPANMLREYRRQSDDTTREQAQMFRALSASDQRELLFYMLSHVTLGLQHVHGLIDAEAAKTRGFDTIASKTQ